MRVFVGASLAVCLVAACELSADFRALDSGAPRDAGTRADGGLVDGGTLDASVVDAATDGGDAGEEDCGFSDAGVCSFPEPEVFPYTCTGEEDFCDPAEDVPSPATDLVAGWSRIEGDTFILELRFFGMPFFGGSQDVVVVFHDAPVAPGNHAGAVFPEGNISGLRLDLGNWLQPSHYPPHVLFTNPPFWCCVCFEPPPYALYDRCSVVRLSPTLPILELRLPVADVAGPEGVRYAVFTARPNEFGPPPMDKAWPDGSAPVYHSPRGGSTNGIEDLTGICELRCPGG